jgi:uncharacterized protein (TIGR02246 family)
MKKLKVGFVGLLIATGLMFASCNAPAEEAPTVAKPDMASVKAQIQELENAWAEADNARDLNAIMALMADDAATMPENMPTISGKAAIQKDYETSMAKKAAGTTVSYEVLEVFGSEDQVTEVGKAVTKDAEGKVLRSGKYMAVWEKRDGKYLCIRDIGNSDAKAE